MKVAVIVLNYNSASDTKKCISYLVKQSGVELDIIVVDNSSSTEERFTLELVLSEYKDICAPHIITYIPNDENHGYNAGNNIGLRYASQQGYKYALISNPDMEFPDTEYVSKMVHVMCEDSKIAVQGSDIINNEGIHQNPQRETTYLEELIWIIQLFKSRSNRLWNVLDYKESCICDKISGCCLLIRISFLETVNFFDEHVFLYSEESILGAQVKLKGMKLFYNSTVYAIHRHIEKSKGRVKPRMRILYKSRWYYLKTYSTYPKIALCLLKFSKTIQRLIFVR